MGSEARLYTFSQDTKAELRKFRLGTSRAKKPQAKIYHIDRTTLEILPEESGETYTSLAAISDALPENAPRFVLLSYPLTLANGREAVPYVLLNYIPATAKQDARMLYAGARELVRNTAEAGRVIEVSEAEEVEGLEEVLRG